MDYIIRVTIHVYADEKLVDEVLVLHSKNYGIVGKEIIVPLRKSNGKEYCIENVQKTFTVADLWDWIEYKLYGGDLEPENNVTFRFVQEYNVLEKYLMFNGLRYTIEDINIPLIDYLYKMGVSENEKLNVQILVSSNAGTVFKDDGIRYYMYSKEYGQHNVPHVHVDIRHEVSGSFSIIDGSLLSGEGIKKRDVSKIKKTIEKRKKELLHYWNEHTDGLTVDLNQALGIIQY